MEYIGYVWEVVAALVIIWTGVVTVQEYRFHLRERYDRERERERFREIVGRK